MGGKITYENSIERFSEKFKKSKELTEKCRNKIPGAYSRGTYNYGPHAIYVDHGEGQYIHTIDGHRLLDFNNNFTVNVLGHNHPKITNAILEAIPKGISFGNPTKYESRLAQIICDRIESIDKVKFSCSASESCISAVRIARAITGKNRIAKFEGGYHGFFDDLHISVHPAPDRFPGPSDHPIPLAESSGIPSQQVENTVILPQNDLKSCEKILRRNAHNISCVIMELQSGAGGVVVLKKEFVEGIRALTKELDIIMIVDEAITLRADYHGMQGVYGIKPDLTVMGKVLGGGLPLGAVGGRAEYLKVAENGQVRISGTHHGHALSVVAGIACLEAMDEAACNRLNRLAKWMKDELNEWADRENYPFLIYGEFSFLGYAFTDKKGREIRSHRDFWDYTNDDHILTFALEMANRGFFPVHRGQLSLSLPMTDEDINSFITTTKEIVTGMLDK